MEQTCGRQAEEKQQEAAQGFNFQDHSVPSGPLPSEAPPLEGPPKSPSSTLCQSPAFQHIGNIPESHCNRSKSSICPVTPCPWSSSRAGDQGDSPGLDTNTQCLVAKMEDCLVWLQPDRTRREHWT